MMLRIHLSSAVALLLAYAGVLIVYDLTGFGPLKDAANGVAVVSILACLAGLQRFVPKSHLSLWVGSAAMMTLAVLSLFVNPSATNVVELFKISTASLFVLVGIRYFSGHTVSTPLALMFAVTPVLYWVSLAIESGAGFGGLRTSLFANRNNLVFFVLVSTLPLRRAGVSELGLLAYSMFVPVILGTLGGMAAVVAAIAICYGKSLISLPRMVIGFFSVPIILGLAVASGSLIRVIDNFGGAFRVISNLGLDGLVALDYGRLRLAAGSSDLSFLFRLKHWTDLIDTYAHAGISNVLFGFGVGSSVALSEHQLLPHNDYLRLLFEFGLFFLIAFVLFAFLISRRIGSAHTRFVFVFFIIYMTSENLLNNFLCMTTLFLFVGAESLVVRGRNVSVG